VSEDLPSSASTRWRIKSERGAWSTDSLPFTEMRFIHEHRVSIDSKRTKSSEQMAVGLDSPVLTVEEEGVGLGDDDEGERDEEETDDEAE